MLWIPRAVVNRNYAGFSRRPTRCRRTSFVLRRRIGATAAGNEGLQKGGSRMVGKISKIVSDEYFADWVWAFIPIAGIVILAIALVTISLVRGGICR